MRCSVHKGGAKWTTVDGLMEPCRGTSNILAENFWNARYVPVAC